MLRILTSTFSPFGIFLARFGAIGLSVLRTLSTDFERFSTSLAGAALDHGVMRVQHRGVEDSRNASLPTISRTIDWITGSASDRL